MNCIHCQGKMLKKTAPYHIDRQGFHVVIDVVPAWVCSQCGEVYFEESQVESIQNVIRALDTQISKLPKSA
ncbi:MAG: YgiT-type zinc finger protein [Elusimicrobiota bacterium]